MIYYFMVLIKLKHQTKLVATQHAHILYQIILDPFQFALLFIIFLYKYIDL